MRPLPIRPSIVFCGRLWMISKLDVVKASSAMRTFVPSAAVTACRMSVRLDAVESMIAAGALVGVAAAQAPARQNDAKAAGSARLTIGFAARWIWAQQRLRSAKRANQGQVQKSGGRRALNRWGRCGSGAPP